MTKIAMIKPKPLRGSPGAALPGLMMAGQKGQTMRTLLSARIAVIDFLYDTLFKVTDWLQERRDKALTAWSIRNSL